MTQSQGAGVLDLHTHLNLKTQLFGFKFTKSYKNPAGTFPLTLRNNLPSLKAGGVKAFLCSTYVIEKQMKKDVWPIALMAPFFPPGRHIFRTPADEMAFEMMDNVEAVIQAAQDEGEAVVIVRSYQEMQDAIAAGKIAVLHSLEGAHHLNGDLDNVQRFFDRGVCHMIIPHFYDNEACSCIDPIPSNQPLRWIGCWRYPRDEQSGMTDFGRELVDRMLDIGMIVDMSHTTPTARQEILDQAKAHSKKRPIIMSHVGVHKYAPFPMNPTAEDIRQIAETGGVVGLLFMTFFLGQPEVHHCADLIRKSVEHLVEHGGEEVVSFGSDFDGFTGVPKDFRSPRDYVRLREVLRSSFSEAQVDKFLFGNAQRVLRDGWGN